MGSAVTQASMVGFGHCGVTFIWILAVAYI